MSAVSAWRLYGRLPPATCMGPAVPVHPAMPGHRRHTHQARPVEAAALDGGNGRAGTGASRRGSALRAGRSDADDLAQVYGPARTPLPRTTPADRQADAMTALNAIEAATTWRQLPSIFSFVTKLPQNHVHLLAMAQALVTLSSAVEAAYESAGPEQQVKLQLELRELQGFARELVRATRMPVDAAYPPAGIASLLRCFCSLGVLPPTDWLEASEAALVVRVQWAREQGQGAAAGGVAGVEGVGLRDALAVLAAATFYKVCGHRPSPKFVQLLPACGAIAWGPAPGLEMSVQQDGIEVEIPSDQGNGVEAQHPVPAEFLAILGHAAMMWDMPTEDRWLLGYLDAAYLGLQETIRHAESASEASSSAGRRGKEGGGLGDDGAAAAAMGAEAEAGAGVVHFDLGGVVELLWSAIMSGACPNEQWMRTYVDASHALLRSLAAQGAVASAFPTSVAASVARSGAGAGAEAGVGASVGTICDLVSALIQLRGAPGSVPGPEWVEAALSCAALSRASTVPDVIGQLLFDVGAFDQPLTDDARRSAILLAQRAQMLMMAEDDDQQGGAGRGAVGAAAGRDGDAGARWTGKGLALLLMGLVRCGLPPSQLPSGWLAAWGRRAAAVAAGGGFGAEEVIGVLAAAAEASEQLPENCVQAMVGAIVRPTAAAAPAQAAPSMAPGSQGLSAEELSQAGSSSVGGFGEEGVQEGLQLDGWQFAALMGVLSEQSHCRLPSTWLGPIKALARAHLAALQRACGNEGRPAASGEQPLEDDGAAGAARGDVQRLCLSLLVVAGMFEQGASGPGHAAAGAGRGEGEGEGEGEVSAWLVEVVRAMEGAGGLREAEGLSEVSKALGLCGEVAEPAMLTVEAACLSSSETPTLTPRHYRHICSAFARTGLMPSGAWWRQMQGSLESSWESLAKEGGETAALHEDLSGVLAATCGLLASFPGKHEAAERTLAWLRSWACDGLATLDKLMDRTERGSGPEAGATSGDVSSGASDEERAVVMTLEAMLPALAVLPDRLSRDACGTLCSLTARLQGLGGQQVASSCLDVLNASGYAAPADWLLRWVQDIPASFAVQQEQQPQEQLGQQGEQGQQPSLQSQLEAGLSLLDVKEMCSLLQAAALHAQAFVERRDGSVRWTRSASQGLGAAGQGSAETPGVARGVAEGTSQLFQLMPRLVAEVGSSSAMLSSDQLVVAVRAAAVLCDRAAIPRGAPGVDRLLDSAGRVAPRLSLTEVVLLLQSAVLLGVTMADRGLQRLAAALVRPLAPSDGEAGAGASRQGQQQGEKEGRSGSGTLLGAVCSDPALLDELVSALGALGVQFTGIALQHLVTHLPTLAASRPAVAAHALYFLAGQQQWEGQLETLGITAQRLVTGVVSGTVPRSEHAPILAALSAVATRGDMQPERSAWLPDHQVDAVADACGAVLADYDADDMCSIIASLNNLGAELPAPWIERFCDYAIPSRCTVGLLPAAAMAVAFAVASDGDPGAAASGVHATPWLRRVEAAVAAAPGNLSCRDAALLFTAFAQHSYRPAQALVHELLELALARAQQEQQSSQDPGMPGPEAVGVVALLAAAHTSLGYYPTAEWAERAWAEVLSPVVPRIQDPDSRQAVEAALAGANKDASA